MKTSLSLMQLFLPFCFNYSFIVYLYCSHMYQTIDKYIIDSFFDSSFTSIIFFFFILSKTSFFSEFLLLKKKKKKTPLEIVQLTLATLKTEVFTQVSCISCGPSSCSASTPSMPSAPRWGTRRPPWHRLWACLFRCTDVSRSPF